MSTEPLVLDLRTYQEIIEHARRDAPAEAVGMLGGLPDGAVRKRIELTNLADGNAFLVDPYSQYCALKTFKADGLVPLAIYHSHPDGPAQLSMPDRHFASRVPLIHVVVSFGSGNRRPRLRAFSVTPYSVDEVSIIVS